MLVRAFGFSFMSHMHTDLSGRLKHSARTSARLFSFLISNLYVRCEFWMNVPLRSARFNPLCKLRKHLPHAPSWPRPMLGHAINWLIDMVKPDLLQWDHIRSMTERLRDLVVLRSSPISSALTTRFRTHSFESSSLCKDASIQEISAADICFSDLLLLLHYSPWSCVEEAYLWRWISPLAWSWVSSIPQIIETYDSPS